MQFVWDWFRWLYDTTGINLTIFYDAFDRGRFASGFWMTIRLSLVCILASVVIGVIGAWVQGSRLRSANRRALVHPGVSQHAAARPALFLLLRSRQPAEGRGRRPARGERDLGDRLAVVLRRRVQRRDLPIRCRSGSADDDRGGRIPGFQPPAGTYLRDLPHQPARAQQQPRQPREDDDAGVCDRRAGDALRVEPDLVG